MGAGSTANRASTTLLEKLTTGLWRLPLWILALFWIFIFSLPFLLAWLEGSLSALLEAGRWRIMLIEPTITLYIFVVTPPLARVEHAAIEAFRAISLLDSAAFDRLVASTWRIGPRAEMIAIAAGAAVGFLLSSPQQLLTQPSPLRFYVALTSLVRFGLMGWVIFDSLAGSRRLGALNHQPLTVNIFNLRPFEPIGRQSLAISLVFVGGTVLSLLFVFSPENFLTLGNLVIYGTLVIVIILLFFFNMWQTHLVLAGAKQEALTAAQQNIEQIYRRLAAAQVEGAAMPIVAAEVNAWITLEQRLKLARTWPYNTEMLRTLFLSVMIPILLALVRLAFNLFTSYAFHL